MRGHADDFPLELASAIPTREWNYVEEKSEPAAPTLHAILCCPRSRMEGGGEEGEGHGKTGL